VGKSTRLLGELNVGDEILDFVGPLGRASHLEGLKDVAVVGGGLGCAIAYPQAKALHAAGVKVDLIAGFRTKDLIILEDEMKAVSENLYICTDDGSYGEKGFVTDMLKKLILSGRKYDEVIVVGPLIMMKFIARLTKEYGIKTTVSMNPVMIDGTGMCGGCRLTVGGETKFACVDGPEFDGHLVDFDEAIRRSSMYKAEEKAKDEAHKCRMEGIANA
jgi:ferredoxin--NADP+ reductase